MDGRAEGARGSWCRRRTGQREQQAQRCLRLVQSSLALQCPLSEGHKRLGGGRAGLIRALVQDCQQCRQRRRFALRRRALRIEQLRTGLDGEHRHRPRPPCSRQF
jgi:hypothetical protein